MDNIFFIGRFPPPYGGATVKAEVIYKALSNNVNVDKFDTELKNKNRILFFIKLLRFIHKNKKESGIICVASISLFKLTKYIYFINSSMIKRMSVFAIGGAIDDLLIKYKVDISMMNKYKAIYVECKGTKENLEKIGLRNVKVIPNCRIKPENRTFVEVLDKNLSCAFISRIDKNKGVLKIIESFSRLSNKYQVDFYGPIDDNVKSEFLNAIESNENINYKGIIKTNEQDIYSIISRYDLILFPTLEGEGYPGIIAEAKIAGVPVISSEFRYSKEIIQNYKDSIILSRNTPDEICEVLMKLQENRPLLNELRKGAYLSGEKCFIENYLEEIIDDIKRSNVE